MTCAHCGKPVSLPDAHFTGISYSCSRPITAQDPLINAIGHENAQGTLLYHLAQQTKLLEQISTKLTVFQPVPDRTIEVRLREELAFHKTRADELERLLREAVDRLNQKTSEG